MVGSGNVNFDTFIWGLIICFLLSFLIGLERQLRRRFIGLRTMILVAIGTYMFVSFSFMISGSKTVGISTPFGITLVSLL